MQWIKKMGVGMKLILGFSLMIAISVCIGLTGYYSAGKIQRSLEDIFSVRLPSIDYLIEADRDLQQLLVAERTMIFAEKGSDIFQKMVDDYEENLKQSHRRWQKYKSLAATQEEKEIIPVYEKAREAWMALSRRIVMNRQADTEKGRTDSIELTLGAVNEKFEKMRDQLDRLTELNLSIADTSHKEAASVYNRTVVMLLTIIGIGAFLGIALMLGLGRAITGPLNRAIAGLNEGASQVTSASRQVSASSQRLAEGASKQAASIEETSSSLEEMSSMTQQNAKNAGQADNLMQETNQVVEQANAAMRELTNAMAEISKSSEETFKIIKTIDEIAFQTNLLALNAAVEAARAGEAGAGFAVVADEVRNLAMRAADSARNTANLIEGTVTQINDGSELVTRSNEAFSQVAESSKKVGDFVSEIAAASHEQAQGIEQINGAVSEMDKVVQQVAAGTEESASTSEEMSAQAEELKGFVRGLMDIIEGNRRHPSTEFGGSGRALAGPKTVPSARSHVIEGTAAGSQVGRSRTGLLGSGNFEDF